MGTSHHNDSKLYYVVTNQERHYFIWPADRAIPTEWNAEGKCGTKRECLQYILQVWKNMRPPTLREMIQRAMPQPSLNN